MKLNFGTQSLFALTLGVATFFAGLAVGRSFEKQPQATSQAWDFDPAVTQSPNLVAFDADTFREDIAGLINEKQYASAVSMLMLASESDLYELHKGSYCGVDASVVNGGTPRLPGTPKLYDKQRDWLLPDSGDSESITWSTHAELFAERYNRYALSKSQIPRGANLKGKSGDE